MPKTEARKSLIRIGANYVRLFGGLTMAVILVPLLVGWIGLDAFGLISLLGASAGFASLFLVITSQGMVRELGAAHHDENQDRFIETYNSAYLIAAGAACLAVVGFAVVMIILPVLDYPRQWTGAARIFLLAQMSLVVIQIMLSPAVSMYQVREQFGWFAFWTLVQRSTALISVLVLAFAAGIADVETALIAHGICWSSLMSLAVFAAAIWAVARDHRLLLRPSRMCKATARRLLHTFGWNSTIHIAWALHERVAAVIMNLAFGVTGSAVFEVSLRLAAYVRMITVGVVGGIEATSARMSAHASDRLSRLLHHSMRLQGVVAIPAGLVVFMFADELLRLWIARQIENPDEVLPLAVGVVRVLMLAMVGRALSDGWMLVMYGAGHVRKYAPTVLAGGCISPIVGLVLLEVLPDSMRHTAPAIGYMVVVFTVNFLLVPRIAARCLSVPYRSMFIPGIRPLITTALCSPLLIVPAIVVVDWSLLRLGLCFGTFGVVYTVATWIIVLSQSERRRVVAGLGRVASRVFGSGRESSVSGRSAD